MDLGGDNGVSGGGLRFEPEGQRTGLGKYLADEKQVDPVQGKGGTCEKEGNGDDERYAHARLRSSKEEKGFESKRL
jgi:hypothetical protein